MNQLLLRSEQFSEVVGLIYACAVDTGKTATLLQELAQYLDGTDAYIHTRNLVAGTVLASHARQGGAISPQTDRDYVGHWGALDPRTKLLASLPSGQVLRCHEHFDEDYVSGSEFYQDFLIPNGFRWAVGGMYYIGAATATVVAAVRAVGTTPFSEEAENGLRQMLPHFRRADLIGSRLERQTAAIRSAGEMLQQLPVACLVTDEMGRCLDANNAFREAMQQLGVRLVMGRVRFSDPQLQSGWEAALFETQATGLGRSVRGGPCGAGPWAISLIPWHPLVEHADATDRRMILAVLEQKPAEVQPDPDVMSRAGLTRAELEVLASLLKGLTVKAIANRRGASFHTVRSQIVSILGKTGFATQKELIASFGASTFGDSTLGDLPRATRT
jgi:DNA-binding CsgD family transcriptional regulator